MSLRRLFIDIETAPALAYIWGLKTRYVPISQVAEDGYILCFAYYWEGEDHTGFYSLWDHGHENMIQAAHELLSEADHVITYNGKNFDIPRLNAEFLVAGLGPPDPYYHTDMFEGIRPFRFTSKSLKHLLSLLELDNKLEHKGMDLWTGVMEGDKPSQLEMEDYNVQDVVIMEDLYHKLYPWLKNVPNERLYATRDDDGKLYCRCGSDKLRNKGYEHGKVLSYKRYKCQSCGSNVCERFTATRGRKDTVTW